jgi:uncharacterized membrane protein YfcA
MSGVGSAMLTTPVWLSLGFPLPVAIASNQMNGAAGGKECAVSGAKIFRYIVAI